MAQTTKLSQGKKALLRWCGWFFVGNILVFWLIGLRYVPTIHWLFNTEYLHILGTADRISLMVYLSISYLGFMAILAFLPAFLIAFFCVLLPNRQFIHFIFIVISILLATFLISLLLVDSSVYNLFHFHLNGIIWDFFIDSLKNQQNILNLSTREIWFVVSISASLFIFELVFAFRLWGWLQTVYQNHHPEIYTENNRFKYEKIRQILSTTSWGLSSFIILCILISYSVFIPTSIMVYQGGDYANRTLGHALLEASRTLPLYNKILGIFLPVKHSLKDGEMALTKVYERNIVQPAQAYSPLNYPLEPLEFIPAKKPMNIVMIIIDAWRFDMLNKEVTPNLYNFSKTAWVFNQHFSGGNATGPGIYSLFYSIPATYWTAMQEQHKSPVFIDQLLKQQYQMNILASAGLIFPNFKSTVFQSIPNLRDTLPGENPYEKDRKVTEYFKNFLDTMDSQTNLEEAIPNPRLKPQKNTLPFFSFLFYDSAHAYCQINNVLEPFTPAIKVCNRLSMDSKTDPIPYFNRYKNALYLVDQQIGQVLDTLKTRQLLENTIVIVTGDHGEEFNDNKLGFFGHTGNFTHFQTQTPLIIYWPGQSPRSFDDKSSHYDIVPTLMEKVLGIQTPPDAYCIGTSLLNKIDSVNKTNIFQPGQSNISREYLIVNSYIGVGIIEKDRITTIYPTGEFEITDLHGKPIPNATPRVSIVKEVFQTLRYFFKK